MLEAGDNENNLKHRRHKSFKRKNPGNVNETHGEISHHRYQNSPNPKHGQDVDKTERRHQRGWWEGESSRATTGENSGRRPQQLETDWSCAAVIRSWLFDKDLNRMCQRMCTSVFTADCPQQPQFANNQVSIKKILNIHNRIWFSYKKRMTFYHFWSMSATWGHHGKWTQWVPYMWELICVKERDACMKCIAAFIVSQNFVYALVKPQVRKVTLL